MNGHKWFAALYDSISASEERSFVGPLRADLLADVTGRVLEIGAGTGANFPYYGSGAQVTATELDPFMLRHAQRRLKEVGAAIELRQASAEDCRSPTIRLTPSWAPW